MTYAKCLLVALALWMPVASFAAAVGAAVRVEHAEPCAEPETSESESESEENEVFLASPAAALAPSFEPDFEHDGHRSLDSHIVELLIPPPKPTSPR